MNRYIDADALCEEFTRFVRKANNHDFEPTPTWNDAISIFHSMPTVDAVEVIPCKDCVHYQPSLFGEKKMCFRKDVDGIQVCYDFSPDDYCSYAERRKDEN